MAKRARLKDIAEAAGVSVTAASFVLNGRAREMRLSADVEERVRRAARGLGYIPSVAARGLAQRGRDAEPLSIAIVMPEQAPVALAGALIRGLRSYNAELRAGDQPAVRILVETYDEGRLEDLTDLRSGNHFNGAIVTNTSPEDDRYLAGAYSGVPIVVFNRRVPGHYCVNRDYAFDGEAAARDLLDKGCTRLIILRQPTMSQVAATRIKGLRRVLEQKGLRDIAEVVCPERSEFAARDATIEALADHPEADGIYCVDGYFAPGVSLALRIAHRDDVALVGEDYVTATLKAPGSSYADVPTVKMALEAVRLLMGLLYGKETRAPYELVFVGNGVELRPCEEGKENPTV